MDIVEYMENVLDIKLLDAQKIFLRKIEEADKAGKELRWIPARASRKYCCYLASLYYFIEDERKKGGDKDKCETDISTG